MILNWILDWFERFFPPKFEEVGNARLHRLVHEEVERLLLPRGFEAVGDLKWVRGQDAPIRQVFTLSKYKGGTVRPVWGVSLDFVPHISGKQVKWHRSNKTAKLDLCFDPGRSALDMSYLNGARPILRRHKAVVGKAIEQAEGFWARCGTVEALPEAVAWLKAQYDQPDERTFHSFSQHFLAAAFVLKGRGRQVEALAELDRGHMELWEPEVWRRLRAMVAE